MSFDPHLNDKGKNYSHIRKKGIDGKVPDILSQAEAVVNDFISKPLKRKKNAKAFLISLYFSISVVAIAIYLIFALK